MSNLLYEGAEWDFDKIQRVYDACEEIARDELKLDWYENQIEVISSEQMLDAYTSVGMPIMYNHWSFGKSFVQQHSQYKRGQMGLAYEIVINSDPCISYLMEENTMTMQTLVIAHAAFGHNHFFKNNYLFKEWTDADAIIPYLSFAKRYISDCEERYGEREVEMILNSCHALQNQGINKYKRPTKMSVQEEKHHQTSRQQWLDSQVNHLWKSIIENEEVNKTDSFPSEPEENILWFMEKHSPNLEPWQREIVRIVRKIAQYFYPQPQTKTMNEGCATYVHYYIMNRLWEKGMISDGNMKEFLISHTSVVFQPDFDDVVIYKDPNTGEEKAYSRYNGINPYALGFDMFRDMERICKTPTEEDKYYFPEMAGKDWLETFHYSIENFRDESFIRQFLSPELVRKWKMFVLSDDSKTTHYSIDAIQNEAGFESIRNTLAEKHTLSNYYPDIKISDVDIKGDRTMYLTHKSYDGVLIGKDDMEDMIKHLYRLWGHGINIQSFDDEDDSLIEEFEIDFSDPEDDDDPF